MLKANFYHDIKMTTSSQCCQNYSYLIFKSFENFPNILKKIVYMKIFLKLVLISFAREIQIIYTKWIIMKILPSGHQNNFVCVRKFHYKCSSMIWYYYAFTENCLDSCAIWENMKNMTIDHKMDLAISLSTTNSDNVWGKNKAIEIFGKKQEWLVKTNMARANTSG